MLGAPYYSTRPFGQSCHSLGLHYTKRSVLAKAAVAGFNQDELQNGYAGLHAFLEKTPSEHCT